MASKKLALKVEGGSGTETSVDVSPSDHLLELSRRAIAALPHDLGTRLPALRTLRVPHNRIAELTVALLRSLSALEELDVSDNGLASLPSAGLLALQTLRVLRVARQRGSKGERLLLDLPDAVGALPRLDELDVSGNALSELPAGLADGPVRVLLAADNPLRLRLHDEEEPSATEGRATGGPAGGGAAREAELFCDTDFPATSASLFRDPGLPWRGHPEPRRVQWLRPAQLCAAGGDEPPLKPALFVDGGASTDVVQGVLGDCWLLSAVAGVLISGARTTQEQAAARVCYSRLRAPVS